MAAPHRTVSRVWRCPVGNTIAVYDLTPHTLGGEGSGRSSSTPTSTAAGEEERQRCLLTEGHPVWDAKQNRWRRAEELASSVSYERHEYVYTLELDGHEDTVEVGGVVCAALGVYCGPDFGWNLFTRKTMACKHNTIPPQEGGVAAAGAADGVGACPVCAVVCDGSLDFRQVTGEMFREVYAAPHRRADGTRSEWF
eukprot:GDKI01023974.1.p1 GENE.GDKI01023974.1~~GDKI01023974.1.p1  ORF type:complete len:196 (-),score=64.29 GDKI01023974.1:22-609(-)